MTLGLWNGIAMLVAIFALHGIVTGLFSIQTKDVFEANNRVLCGLVFAIFAFVLWITNVPS
jgi:uncharacterized membrane protein